MVFYNINFLDEIDVNSSQDSTHQSLIILACQKGYVNVFKALLRKQKGVINFEGPGILDRQRLLSL